MFGIDDLIGAGLKIIDKFIPDPAAKQAAMAELQRMNHDELMAFLDFDKTVVSGQMEINKQEAASADPFTSRARPFIMWTCGAAFAMHFVLFPVLNFIVGLFGGNQIVVAFDMDTLMTVLLGILGLGGLRTVEKIKKVAS